MSGATATGGPGLLPRSSLWELVTRRAGETPDTVMAVDELGRSITFGGFRQRAEEAAAGLRELGVRAGTTVVWQLPTSIEATVLMAALARLGALQAPVLPILRERELTFITRQLTADLLIVPGLWRGFDYPAMARAISRASGSSRSGCRLLSGSFNATNEGSRNDSSAPASAR
jgi:non-ribosomal peptide synthetase component E (peptide arylation enzyme)